MSAEAAFFLGVILGMAFCAIAALVAIRRLHDACEKELIRVRIGRCLCWNDSEGVQE